MRDDFTHRIVAIFNDVLRIPPENLSDQTRRGDVDGWDSLGHILLIEALSNEFDVAIAAEQALDMESIQDIKRILIELKT